MTANTHTMFTDEDYEIIRWCILLNGSIAAAYANTMNAFLAEQKPCTGNKDDHITYKKKLLDLETLNVFGAIFIESANDLINCDTISSSKRVNGDLTANALVQALAEKGESQKLQHHIRTIIEAGVCYDLFEVYEIRKNKKIIRPTSNFIKILNIFSRQIAGLLNNTETSQQECQHECDRSADHDSV